MAPKKKPANICCVVACKNNSENSPGTHFYTFSTVQHKRMQRDKWIRAARRKNSDGSPWQPSKRSRICSQHFIGNKKSEHPLSPSFVPTIFPKVYSKTVRSELSAKAATERFKRNLKRQTITGHLQQSRERSDRLQSGHVEEEIKTSPENHDCLNTTVSQGIQETQYEIEATKPTVAVKDEPEDCGEPLNDYDLCPMSVKYLTFETVKLENVNDTGPCVSQVKSENVSNAVLRVSLIRLEDSKDPEIVKYMNIALKSTRPHSSCFEGLKTSAFAEIKRELVDIGVSTNENVSDACQRSDSVITAVKNEFTVIGSGDHCSGEEIEEKLHECNICLATVSDKSVSIGHASLCTIEKSHKCGICEHTFTSNSCLNNHMSSHSGEKEKPNVCDVCWKKFARERDLSTHMLIHEGEKRRTCNICLKKVSEERNLKRHMLTHDGKKLYACKICQKKYKHKAGVNIHMFIHTGEKPHRCNLCSEKFTYKKTLKYHMLIHNGEMSHTCNVCPEKFSQKRKLIRHMLIHNVERRHECNICLRKFSRKGNLKDHILGHNGEKQYACDVCQKKFSRKNTLKTHMLLHNDEKPHACNICGESFRHKRTLISHMFIHD